MRHIKALDLIKQTLQDISENGFDADKVVEQLKALRPYAIEEKNPLMAKVIRLTYERIEANGEFNIEFLEEGDATENLVYLLNLMSDCYNKYNREEIREIGYIMKPPRNVITDTVVDTDTTE